jgi:hypothetical protein
MENNEARHILNASFAGLHSGKRRTVELTLSIARSYCRQDIIKLSSGALGTYHVLIKMANSNSMTEVTTFLLPRTSQGMTKITKQKPMHIISSNNPV